MVVVVGILGVVAGNVVLLKDVVAVVLLVSVLKSLFGSLPSPVIDLLPSLTFRRKQHHR